MDCKNKILEYIERGDGKFNPQKFCILKFCILKFVPGLLCRRAIRSKIRLCSENIKMMTMFKVSFQRESSKAKRSLHKVPFGIEYFDPFMQQILVILIMYFVSKIITEITQISNVLLEHVKCSIILNFARIC